MPRDITIPKIGKVPTKWVWVTVAGVGGYVAWRWYQARNAAPATGVTSDVVGDSVNPSGVIGGAPSGNTQYAGSVTDATDPSKINNTSDWVNAAADKLSSSSGWEPGAVYAALGDYLAHAALSEDEIRIVRAALAAVPFPGTAPQIVVAAAPKPVPTPVTRVPRRPAPVPRPPAGFPRPKTVPRR